jgi:O-antigen/teichoic acid export membrane protein
MFALVLGLALAVGRAALLRFIGPEFVDGETALLILIGGQLVNASFGLVGLLLVMCGRETAVLVATAAAAVTSLVANFTLIPALGIEGAATAAVISTAVFNVQSAWSARRHLGLLVLPFGVRGWRRV